MHLFLRSFVSLLPCNPTRRGHPLLGGALELLGLVGILGLGRVYAGDPAAGRIGRSWRLLIVVGLAIGLSSLIVMGGLSFTVIGFWAVITTALADGSPLATAPLFALTDVLLAVIRGLVFTIGSALSLGLIAGPLCSAWHVAAALRAMARRDSIRT